MTLGYCFVRLGVRERLTPHPCGRVWTSRYAYKQILHISTASPIRPAFSTPVRGCTAKLVGARRVGVGQRLACPARTRSSR